VHARGRRSSPLSAAPVELELIDRERRVVERRIKQARFPAVKGLDTFDFTAIASLNKILVLELARCEFILRRENIIALAIPAPARPMSRSPLALPPARRASPSPSPPQPPWRMAVKLLIVDELGYVPLSPTGAELLFEVLSQRYERGSTIVTSDRRGLPVAPGAVHLVEDHFNGVRPASVVKSPGELFEACAHNPECPDSRRDSAASAALHCRGIGAP
jgi:hypothetical protein